MPGYEKSRFANLNPSEEEELICGICLGILKDPMVTQCCRQTYCEECIKQWLTGNNTCPNDRKCLSLSQLSPAPRLVINMLNKLRIKCEFFEKGCTESIILENLKQHLEGCYYNPKTICNDCGQEVGSRKRHNCLANMRYHIRSLEELGQNSEVKCYGLENKLKEKNEEVVTLKLENKFLINEKNEILKYNELLVQKMEKLERSNSSLLAENVSMKKFTSKLFEQVKKFTKFESRDDRPAENFKILFDDYMHKIKAMFETFENQLIQRDSVVENMRELALIFENYKIQNFDCGVDEAHSSETTTIIDDQNINKGSENFKKLLLKNTYTINNNKVDQCKPS